jgi:hypothetical protein
LLGYGTAAAVAVATAAEAAASFFSIFSIWLILLSNVFSSRDAESDFVSDENCESEVFAKRKIDERLIKAFPSTDLAGYFNDLSGARAFRGWSSSSWNVPIFRSLVASRRSKLHFLCRTPRSLEQFHIKDEIIFSYVSNLDGGATRAGR